jgi:hypothetical protein
MWKVRLGDEFTLAELSGPPAVTMKQVSPKWTKSALTKHFLAETTGTSHNPPRQQGRPSLP